MKKDRLTLVKYARPSVFDGRNRDADVTMRITVKTHSLASTIARLWENGATRVWIANNVGGVPDWKEIER